MNESPAFYALVLFLSSLAGASVFVITRKQNANWLKLLLSFSAAYLLGLSFLHLFPEVYESGIEFAGWYIIAGFLLQVILDFFSHGVEHGHAHTHTNHPIGKTFLASVMISLWIHAFIEGMPFGGLEGGHDHGHAHHHHHESIFFDHRSPLLVGVSIHKFTESLVFMALLIGSGMKLLRAIFWLVIFAMLAPAGAFVHHYLLHSDMHGLENITPKVIGVLIGILLHVSTTILFEASEGHRFNKYKFGIVLLGLALAALGT
jgi:zinc and cadmium transporter